MIEQFHFLRPEWLLAIIPLLLVSWLVFHRKMFSRSWQTVIDPQLLQHLLLGKTTKQTRLPLILFTLLGLLIIFSLAGPVWQQLPQPVYKQQSALVIALDLSRSMDAEDISPSRLKRARFKLADILKQRREGQTALIAYAASAFTVTPLTDDSHTIETMINSLSTDIMPSQGSNTSEALTKATELLKNAGVSKGDIILITDGIESSAKDMFEDIHQQGHRISILGIGTKEGAPIAVASSGFLKDASGAIVIPKLDSRSLRRITALGGGRYSELTADDSDIKFLLAPLDSRQLNTEASDTDLKADVWREEGPWLLLLVIPFAALAFRRGYLLLLPLFILPYPDQAMALSWDQLWSNSNQRATQQFEQGNHPEAAKLFNDPQWKAAAHYKAGDYQQAVEQLKDIDQADAHYNRGNALARLGQIQPAIEAYEQALKLDPDHEDAKHNKQLLEQQQQNQQQQSQNSDDSSDQQQDSSEQQSSDSSQQQQSSSEQQQSSNAEQSSDQNSSNNNQDNNNESQQSSADNSQQQKQQQENQQQAQQNAENNPSEQAAEKQQMQTSDSISEEELSQQAAQQWLRKVPDQPGELLRRKFKYQYNQQPSSRHDQPW